VVGGSPSGVSSSIFRDLREVVESRNGEFDLICANVDVDPEIFNRDGELVSFEQVGGVLEGAAMATGEPDFGLRFARFVAPGSSGLAGQLQATSPTIRDMMETIVTYGELALRPMTLAWEEYDDAGIFSARIPLGSVASRRQLTDLMMAIQVDRIRLGVGDTWVPKMITFETDRPMSGTRLYYDMFGDGIRFGEECFSIAIESSLLDRELPSSIRGLHETIRPLADEALAVVQNAAGIVGAVAQKTREQLDSGEPVSLAQIAARLDITPRALQWRLAQAETHFDTVLGDVREELALQQLTDNKLSFSEISASLGFAEPSVFTRWSIRRLQGTPTQVRKRLLVEAAGG